MNKTIIDWFTISGINVVYWRLSDPLWDFARCKKKAVLLPSQLSPSVWEQRVHDLHGFSLGRGDVKTGAKHHHAICFNLIMFSIEFLNLVDTDSCDEGQPGRNFFLVLHIVFTKKMDEGELLFLNPLPEEPPAGYRVPQYTDWVAQHYLQYSKVWLVNKTDSGFFFIYLKTKCINLFIN